MSSRPSSTRHTLIVLSVDAETRRPSQYASAATVPPWARSVCTHAFFASRSVGSHTRIVRSAPPVKRRQPSRPRPSDSTSSTQRTPPACAWRKKGLASDEPCEPPSFRRVQYARWPSARPAISVRRSGWYRWQATEGPASEAVLKELQERSSMPFLA